MTAPNGPGAGSRTARGPEVCRQAAQLYRDAGADREAIPRTDGAGEPEGSRERAAVLGAACAPEESSAPDTVAPNVGSHKPVRKR